MTIVEGKPTGERNPSTLVMAAELTTSEVTHPPETLGSPSNATPSAVDQRATIFFDGVCGLCNRWVDFVLARDRSQRFLFSPLQGETARERLQIGPNDSLNSIIVTDAQGTHRKTDAISVILRGLPGIWHAAGALLRIIPRPIRDFGYDLVARNRYRLFGRKETCRLPTPEERSRFLP